MSDVKLIHGDCLIEHEQIESGSVDLILTDLPYGVVKMKESAGNYKVLNTAETWDKAIEPKSIYEIANRLLRKNGKMVLFSQEPYTSRLITQAIANVPFSYRMIWEKDDFANALLCNKAPVSYFEDILVFGKAHQKHDFEGKHPLRDYFSEVLEYIGVPKKTIIERIGQRADHTFRTNSMQFTLCTEETYVDIIKAFGIDSMKGFKPFSELKVINEEYREDLLQRMNDENPSVFNLWQGNKYKSNILKYKKDYSGYHPTQKPILLLEDLIKTFSNDGDLVVDLTMGSGSTGVACVNTNRNFIGIEMKDEYFKIAESRVNIVNSQGRLF